MEDSTMSEMFCFQCEQTAGGKGCTKVGVCGKQPNIAGKQDEVYTRFFKTLNDLLPVGGSEDPGSGITLARLVGEPRDA